MKNRQKKVEVKRSTCQDLTILCTARRSLYQMLVFILFSGATFMHFSDSKKHYWIRVPSDEHDSVIVECTVGEELR